MSRKLCLLVAFAFFSNFALAHPAPNWILERSPHFEIYSQAGGGETRAALVWFEQLRTLFRQQIGPNLDSLPPVRVIAFRSVEEYAPYRLRPTSDAYFAGTGAENYIVMPKLGPAEFPIAAHEYTHLVLHATGLHVPLWLSEGLAEFFSTVRIRESASSVGADLPARSSTLRRYAWIPLSQLLSMSRQALTEGRDRVDLFYAESWALTDMLVLSPEYASHFQDLIASLSEEASSAGALAQIYGKPLDAVARDLHNWVDGHVSSSVPLPGVEIGGIGIQRSIPSPLAVRALIAGLLLATGQFDRAEPLYRELEKESPSDGDIAVALGTIALRKHDGTTARREWKRAIDLGARNAVLCYQYATLADKAGLPGDEILPVLERAVLLKPDFDDARYRLALLEKSAGRYELALADFRAMHVVAPARAFAYWIATADSLNELNLRDEAEAAARKARAYATSPAERAQAEELMYIAQTDIATEFTRDAAGRQYLTTTRVPHNSPDRNPFIEPSDRIRRVQAALKQIECNGGVLDLSVDTAGGTLMLAIPDPSHVQINNGPSEFTCGAQPGTAVTIDYAVSPAGSPKVDGVVRGMSFKPTPSVPAK